MAYVSLGSRNRPLMSSGGGSGSRGGSGGGSGGGTGTGVSSGGMGTSMAAMARSASGASSDSMKPPPGEHAPLSLPTSALCTVECESVVAVRMQAC